MKNKVKKVLVLMATGILCISVQGKAETGLNANEQELIQFFQNGIEYNGKHYTIPSEYINQGINYLKQEGVDITNDQKSEVYGKVDEMAPEGVAQGYLKAESPTVTPKPTAKPDDNSGDNQSSQDNTDPSDKEEPADTPDSGSGTTTNSSSNSDTSNGTSGSKSIPELIETVKGLSDELGVKIAYDAADNNISVVNENGKTVMKAESTIKNTGYRLNQTFGITAGLFALVGLCIHAARKYQLFAHDDET